MRIDGRRAVIADLGLVVPLPGEQWTLPEAATRYLAGDHELRVNASWAGVQAAEALLKHLDERSVFAEERVNELRDEEAGRLEDCFAAERSRVAALHEMQAIDAELRIAKTELLIFKKLEVKI